LTTKTFDLNQEPAMNLTYDAIARRIDHSLLGPTMTIAELEDGCRLAADYGVASVCIKPFAVSLAKKLLDGTVVGVGTTIGFPHGGHASSLKVLESRQALDDGATELDMVVNIGQVIGGDWAAVRDDIAGVVQIAHAHGAIVKVIFENCYLNDEQKAKLCAICGEVNADYVKTSTGYGTGGATKEDILLMRRESPPHVKVKAAGGMRDLDSAIAFAELGCDRLGLSRTADILDALLDRLGEPRKERSSLVSRGTSGAENASY
jgi:deoxyribose-phosphate aldolase